MLHGLKRNPPALAQRQGAGEAAGSRGAQEPSGIFVCYSIGSVLATEYRSTRAWLRLRRQQPGQIAGLTNLLQHCDMGQDLEAAAVFHCLPVNKTVCKSPPERFNIVQ